MKDIARVTYTTSIRPELKEEFKILCAKKKKYQNEVLEELIERALKEEKEKEGEGDGNSDH